MLERAADRLGDFVQPGREVHGLVVPHEQIQQRHHKAWHADHAKRCPPPPLCRDHAPERHAEHRTEHAAAKKAPSSAPRRRLGNSARSTPRRPSRSRLAGADQNAPQAAGEVGGHAAELARLQTDAITKCSSRGSNRSASSDSGKSADRHHSATMPKPAAKLLVATAPTRS